MTSLLANTFIQFKCKNCDWVFQTHESKSDAQTGLLMAGLHARERGHYIEHRRTFCEVITP